MILPPPSATRTDTLFTDPSRSRSVARQPVQIAGDRYVGRRFVAPRVGETVADFLLQVVARIVGRIDDMLGPAAHRFHHLALARDAVGRRTILGERVAPPRFGKAPLELGACAIEEQRLDSAPAGLAQLLDPIDEQRRLEAAAAAVDAEGDS